MLLSDLDVKAGDILKFKKIDKYVFEICVVV